MVTSGSRPPGRRSTVELVALGLLRGAPDPRAGRAFLDHVPLPIIGGGEPDWDVVARAVAGALRIPSSDLGRRLAAARARAGAAADAAVRLDIRTTTVLDPDYPALLREIPDPPLVLWRRGDWPEWPAVAVVGSRNASPEGLMVAHRIARGLSQAGLTVVSGLARGIDAAAHAGALEGPGSTVAVLGSGADVVYPALHRDLAAQVVSRGCVLSEFLPGDGPIGWHFPVRNRIISGLSRAVLVVEASRRSGSLITAREALEQGRDVLAVPGSVTSGGYQGCHDLIKDGARLVETVDDVLEELGWQRPPGSGAPIPRKWPESSNLSTMMSPGCPCDLDTLVRQSGRTPEDLLAELARLELDGFVVRVPGGRFVRLD